MLHSITKRTQSFANISFITMLVLLNVCTPMFCFLFFLHNTAVECCSCPQSGRELNQCREGFDFIMYIFSFMSLGVTNLEEFFSLYTIQARLEFTNVVSTWLVWFISVGSSFLLILFVNAIWIRKWESDATPPAAVVLFFCSGIPSKSMGLPKWRLATSHMSKSKYGVRGVVFRYFFDAISFPATFPGVAWRKIGVRRTRAAFAQQQKDSYRGHLGFCILRLCRLPHVGLGEINFKIVAKRDWANCNRRAFRVRANRYSRKPAINFATVGQVSKKWG